MRELCTEILTLADSIPVHVSQAYQRTYAKTFMLARLVKDQLAVPTFDGEARLKELLGNLRNHSPIKAI